MTIELQQTGALLTPEQAATVIAGAVAVFAILGWRFVRRWRGYRSN